MNSMRNKKPIFKVGNEVYHPGTELCGVVIDVSSIDDPKHEGIRYYYFTIQWEDGSVTKMEYNDILVNYVLKIKDIKSISLPELFKGAKIL